MSNPVAIRYDFDGYGYKYMDSGSGSDWQIRVDGEPLYTHPAKDNYRETHEGFSTVINVTHPAKEHFEDKPQAEELHEILQSNTHPAKTLTDEQILNLAEKELVGWGCDEDVIDFARAILKKASEK